MLAHLAIRSQSFELIRFDWLDNYFTLFLEMKIKYTFTIKTIVYKKYFTLFFPQPFILYNKLCKNLGGYKFKKTFKY